MTTKNVLITGARGGVGTSLAQALAANDWQVFAGVRSSTPSRALRRSNIQVIELDITDEASVAAAATAVSDAVGAAGLHGLVNNAGVIVQGPMELVPIDALRRQFEVNVLGQIAVTQAFLPLLRHAGGTIVNVGAPTGRVAVPMLGPISGSKAALESLTDALRMELKHQGVKVTIVEPGAMQTEIFAKAAVSATEDGFAGSPETQQLYAGALRAASDVTAKQKLSPLDGIVKTIVKALDASKPGARYVVGRDAAQLVMLRRLPQGLRDRVLMGAMGLKADVFDSSTHAAAHGPGAGAVGNSAAR
jgi:NAD(P)-dependent dehydrogenase (short-subunit alcohol dehydrogenase family)